MSLAVYEKMKRGLAEKKIIDQRKERKERRERKIEEMAVRALEAKKKKRKVRPPPESMELSKTELERCFRAFERVGAARTVERVSELFRAVGEFVGEQELEGIMEQVGWQEGQYFSMSQFVKGAEIIKQRVQGDSNRRPNDTEEAFVAIGGAEDMEGFIDPTRLKEIIEEFELKLDVNNLLRTTLSGSEMMDFEDFDSIFSEAAIQEGEHLANEEAMETLRRKFAKADQRMSMRSPTFKMKGKAFGILVKDAVKDNKKPGEEDMRGESPTGAQKVEGGRRDSVANSNSSPPLPASAAPMPLASSLSLTETGEESPLGVSMSLGTTLTMVDKETYLRKGVHSRLYPHSTAPTSTLPTLRSMLISAAGELGVTPGVDFSRCDIKASRQRSRDKVKRDRSGPYSEARRPSIGIEAKLELQHVIKGAVESSPSTAISQTNPCGPRACTPASTFSTTTGRSEPSPVRNPFRQEIPMDFPFFTSTKGLPLLSPKEHEVVKQAQMDEYQSNLDLIESTHPPPKHRRKPGPRSRSSQSTRSYQPSRSSHQGSSRPSTSLGVVKPKPSPSQRGVLSRTDPSIADTQVPSPKKQLTDFLAASGPSPISLAKADISSLYLNTLAQHMTPEAEQHQKNGAPSNPAQPLPSRARLATESNLIVEELRSKANRPEGSKSVFRERYRRTTH